MLMKFGVFIKFLYSSLRYLFWASVLFSLRFCYGSPYWSCLKSAWGPCANQGGYIPVVLVKVLSALCQEYQCPVRLMVCRVSCPITNEAGNGMNLASEEMV